MRLLIFSVLLKEGYKPEITFLVVMMGNSSDNQCLLFVVVAFLFAVPSSVPT